MVNITVHEAKIRGFISAVLAAEPIIGLEKAITEARRLGQETMDSYQLAEAEERVRKA